MSADMKRAVVDALLILCGAIDRLPAYSREHGWRRSTWGCYPLHIANLAGRLEHRWDLP